MPASHCILCSYKPVSALRAGAPLQGLDLEPYGSFVSGLYTPQGDLDLSIEGQAVW